MTFVVAPFPKHQFFDNNGDPAAGFQLFTYASGTTTKLATYEAGDDAANANANPIILDSAGRCSLFLAATTYKFVLAPAADTDPPASPIWTIDQVQAPAPFGVNLDIPVTAGEAISYAECVYMSDSSDGFVAGRWYKADSSNYLTSVSVAILGFPTANIAAGATGTVRIGGRVPNLSGLSTGNRYYVSTPAGSLTNSKIGAMRIVGHADSTTSLILEPQPLTWRHLNVVFGRPGAGALTTGVNHFIQIPFACLITGWTLVAEQSGSVVIDVWSDTYANFPPTVADTIAGSEKPTLTGAQKNQDSNLSTWNPYHPAGNVLGFNVDSVTTINYASLTLELLTV